MDGGRDGEEVQEDRRGAEAFEVRKCRSPLETELHALDLCRFQGSVCRPDGYQAGERETTSQHPVGTSK